MRTFLSQANFSHLKRKRPRARVCDAGTRLTFGMRPYIGSAPLRQQGVSEFSDRFLGPFDRHAALDALAAKQEEG
jgi:hypothetical protein